MKVSPDRPRPKAGLRHLTGVLRGLRCTVRRTGCVSQAPSVGGRSLRRTMRLMLGASSASPSRARDITSSPRCPPQVCPRQVNSNGGKTSFFFGTPSQQLTLSFAVGAGVQIDRGMIPLMIPGPSYDFSSGSTFIGGDFEVYPLLSGWLVGNDNGPHGHHSPAIGVPEPSTYAVFAVALLAAGLLRARRKR
jgi:hypothetical protein